MKALLDRIYLKLASLYWQSSAVIDRTGGTKHPGFVIGVADHSAYILPRLDSGEALEHITSPWDRMFPGWRPGVSLMVYYPAANKPFTKAQFVKCLEDQGDLPNLTPEEIKNMYARVRGTRVVFVPSVAMKRVPFRVFRNFWGSKCQSTGE